MEIESSKDESFVLSQRNKIVDFTKYMNMKDCEQISTPIQPAYLKLMGGKPIENKPQYKEAIGKLLYISTISRPDISVAVNILCRKTNIPNHSDWKAVKRLARYLKETADITLKNSPWENSKLVGYMDANCVKDMTDQKSASGYSFFYGNSLINWTRQKQKLVAQSTAEVETVSVASACNGLEWILQLLEDLGIEPKQIMLFEDNQTCIRICKGKVPNPKGEVLPLNVNL